MTAAKRVQETSVIGGELQPLQKEEKERLPDALEWTLGGG